MNNQNLDLDLFSYKENSSSNFLNEILNLEYSNNYIYDDKFCDFYIDTNTNITNITNTKNNNNIVEIKHILPIKGNIFEAFDIKNFNILMKKGIVKSQQCIKIVKNK